MDSNSLSNPDYSLGLKDGFIDGFIISQPPNEGEHTRERYEAINCKYRSAISPFLSQTPYTLGYANGLDWAAVYLLPTEEVNL